MKNRRSGAPAAARSIPHAGAAAGCGKHQGPPEGVKEYATDIPDLLRIERLEPVGFGSPLLRRHQHKSAMALQKTGHKFHPDVVGLAGFDIQVDHGLLVVRPEGVLPGVEPDAEVAAVLHAG